MEKEGLERCQITGTKTQLAREIPSSILQHCRVTTIYKNLTYFKITTKEEPKVS